MSVEEWALVASVVFAGLWSGLLAMLVLILHRVMVPMSGPEFARFLQGFLPAAEIPFNYVEVIGLVVALAGGRSLRFEPSLDRTRPAQGNACQDNTGHETR